MVQAIRQQPLGWIVMALTLAGLPMVYSATLMDPWNLPRLVGLAGLSGCAWVWMALQRVPLAQLPRWWWGAAVWILGSSMSLFWAPNFGDALYFLGMRLSLLLLLLWLATIGDDRKIVLPLALLGVVQASLGISEMAGWVDMETSGGGPVGTTGNINLFGSLLTLLLPFAAITSLTDHKPQRWLGWGATVLVLSGALLSGSLAVFLALGLMGVLMLSLMGLARWRKVNARQWGWMAGVMAALVVLAPVVWAQLNLDGTVRVDVKMTGITERGFLWRETTAMMVRSPIQGTGLGGWRYEMLKQGLVAPYTTFGTRYYAEPHNDFLGQAAESGLPAGLAYAGMWCLLMGMAVRQGFAAGDRRTRNRAFLLASAVLGWVVFSGFHFPLERMDHLIVAGAIGALVLQREPKGWMPGPVAGRALQLGLACLCLAVVAFGWTRLRHEQHVTNIYAAKSRGDWRMILKESDLAESPYCTTEFNSVTPIAWFRGLAHYQLQQMTEAKAAFLQAMRVNPHHPHVLNNLASTYVALQQLDSALHYYSLARANFPEFTDPYLNAAQVHVAMGDTAMAITVLGTFPELPVKGRNLCLDALEKLR